MNTDEERLARLEKAVRGLGREVEATRTAQAGLAEADDVSKIGALVAQHAERLEQTAENVAELAVALKKLTAAKDKDPVLSWLTGLGEPAAARLALTDLVGWLRKVYLRYGDAELPECWLWHAEVIEELVWLRQAWRAAYLGEPSIRAVGDWHDRHRPGVVRRIDGYAGKCRLTNHLHAKQTEPDATVRVPASDAVGLIADWWTTGRDEHAPEPTREQQQEAAAAINRRARTAGGKS